MNKGAKRKTGKTDIDSVLLKSRKTFLDAYTRTDKVSALLAQVAFDELVETNALTISESHKILNDPQKVMRFLEHAEKQYQERNSELNRKILERVADNTSTTNTVKIGVGISTFFFAASLVVPFISDWWKQSANENSKPRTTTTVEAPVQTQQPVCGETTNNYYFLENVAPAQSKPDRKPPQKAQHRRNHQPR